MTWKTTVICIDLETGEILQELCNYTEIKALRETTVKQLNITDYDKRIIKQFRRIERQGELEF